LTQHTKDKLADALRALGLHEMAEQAAEGWYHDFLSPLAMPEMQLVRDLTAAMNAVDPDAGQPIAKLRKRVIDGEFDASEEESDEWAKSEEGQDAMRHLVRKEQWRT
jgi:hypothetical protein